MHLHRLATSDTESLQRLFALHDEMPREWDPSHQISLEWRARILKEVQAAPEPHAFWVLTESEKLSAEGIIGILWAVKKVARDDRLECSMNSLWLAPKHREKNLVSMMSEACVKWAREQGAVRLICSTHFQNHRMREILEKHQFQPGMIEYTIRLTE